jgi:hypothetical protein
VAGVPRRVVLFAALAALAACRGGPVATTVTFETGRGHRFAVRAEVADDPAERARGLMDRAALDPSAGMLFLFDEAQPRDFYMFHTLIPLDLVSIRAGRVVGIQRMIPCEAEVAGECPTTTTPPADAAIELNAGTAERAGIEVGALVDSPVLR